MAACSASWRTRSFTNLESMTTAPQIANYRPKEKVGENPPDNASEDPSKLWIIREGRSGSKRATGVSAANSSCDPCEDKPDSKHPQVRASSLKRTLRSAFARAFQD